MRNQSYKEKSREFVFEKEILILHEELYKIRFFPQPLDH